MDKIRYFQKTLFLKKAISLIKNRKEEAFFNRR